MPMNILGEVPYDEEELFRWKVSLEDGEARTDEERGALLIRMSGESVDPISAMEEISEFMDLKEIEGLKTVVLISDYEVMPLPIEGLQGAIKRVRERDEEVAGEIRETEDIPPWKIYLFTVEGDPLERRRAALKIPGSWDDMEKGILKVPRDVLPTPEADIYYVVTEDRFRKLRREDFEEFLESYREGEEEVFEEVEGEAEEIIYGEPQELLEAYGFMPQPELSRPSQGIVTMRRGDMEIVLLQKDPGEGERLLKRILKKRIRAFVILTSPGVKVARGVRSLIVPEGDMVTLERFVRDVLR